MIDTRTAPYAAFLLRLSLGLMFLAHGLTKLFVFTPAGTARFFASLGLPGFVGPLTMVAEITGGVLLILGVAGRQVALLLSPVLLGATLLVHLANGWAFTNPGGGWEYTAFLTAAALTVALLGDGAFALKPLGRRA
ncbi:DoxX family protein [Pseudogulbenkiania subflava]|uniref:Putative oxidoreductase n=1 Tax=Pseudogulbenkiania subflava DSM 22618 TaxID=1123014 RepID=A0A1Y6BBE5_9NEIS|nr:DoxX family protein [Pseudogulbenkiania subflava]SME94362.1 putative oxidoreductase [Pseudogulbenkiania subflava DSM 22618]